VLRLNPDLNLACVGSHPCSLSDHHGTLKDALYK